MLASLKRFPHLAAFLFLLLLGFAPAAEEKRLAVYTRQGTFTIPVFDHASHEYVRVTDLLDPLGRSSLVRDGKKKWKLLFEGTGKPVHGEFNEGSDQAKIRGKKISLGGEFWVDEQRGYIPLSSSFVIAVQATGENSYLRESSRRLFVGDVSTTYSAELQKGTPSRVVLHFSAPVNPAVSTEPGRLRLTFTRDPVVASNANSQKFDDPTIHSASFAENNGSAELTIASSSSLMATFSDGGKTITLSLPPTVAQLPLTPAAPVVTAAPVAPQKPPTLPTAPRVLVLIDPAHGGEDTGETLTTGLYEKDLTLAIARRIRADLEQRGLSAALLREGDTLMPADQRAGFANSSRAAVYLSIHVASLGSGVRIYTAQFQPQVAVPENSFVPWETAQAKYSSESQGVAASLIAQFEAHKVQAVHLQAGLQPLRQVAKPGVALEIAPPSGAVEDLKKPAYQQAIASAVGATMASMRGTLEMKAK